MKPLILEKARRFTWLKRVLPLGHDVLGSVAAVPVSREGSIRVVREIWLLPNACVGSGSGSI